MDWPRVAAEPDAPTVDEARSALQCAVGIDPAIRGSVWGPVAQRHDRRPARPAARRRGLAGKGAGSVYPGTQAEEVTRWQRDARGFSE